MGASTLIAHVSYPKEVASWEYYPFKNHLHLPLELGGCRTMFKIKVINALQTRIGPSKYTSLKTTLQNAAPN